MKIPLNVPGPPSPTESDGQKVQNVVEEDDQPVVALQGRESTILIVEDDAAIREIMSEILRQNNYHVLNAGGGAEALSICERYAGSLALVVIDVVMPQMNGVELVEKLHDLDRHLKVIYTSGYGRHSGAGEGSYQNPAIPMLQKPFRAAELIRLVNEVLCKGNDDSALCV